MVSRSRRDQQGFTLIEAMIAMSLGVLVTILVSSTFLVQNEFYSDAVKRSALQENVRNAVSFVSSELREIAAGGIIGAEADSVVYRVPLAVGGVCAVNGDETYLYFPMEGEILDDDSDVVGYAVRDTSGVWTYTADTWHQIHHSSGPTPARECEAGGADTVGVSNDFYRVDDLVATPAVKVGDLVLIYNELVFKLGTSELNPSGRAIFSGPAEGTLTEFGNGLSAGSAFEYRLSTSSTFQSQVTGGDLSKIVAIRFSALGSAPASRGNRLPLTFDLTVSVPLGNAY
jgi:type II secretory pathway pseudopilin PulG